MQTLTETPFEGSIIAAEEPVPSRLGRFAVLRELGAGGMGVVYAAYDERLDRKVAIKLLHASATGDSVGRARLVREAQAMAKVAHPNVAHVYEVAQQEHRVYVVMQFIDGVDLAAWRKRDAPGWEAAARAYIQAGQGLAAAHAAGLVHRDFKPSNVMIDVSGHVRVLDFGIARAMDEVAATVRESDLSFEDMHELRTRTGAVVGTPAYLPPEVLRGEKADALSDQFSFCVSMFETIYGQRPFGNGKAADLIMALLEGQPPQKPESNVPGWVFRVLSRGLRADASQRYDSMESLLQAIDRGLRGNRAWLGLGALGGLAAAGGVAVALSGDGDADPCPIDRDALGDAWSSSRRSAVESSITAVDATFAAQAWTRVEAGAESYADAWVEGMRNACEATRVRGVQSERTFDLRTHCLSQRRREFEALTRVLTEADVQTLKTLNQMLGALTPVRICETPSASLADEPPPGAVAAVEEIRNDLARARALERAGRDTQGLELAEDVIERADAIDMPSLHAWVAHRSADVVRNAGSYDRSLVLYRRAYFEFVAGGNAIEATAAAADIAELHARRAELPAGLEWIRHGEASLSSLSDPPPILQVDLGYARASIVKKQGDLERAIRLFEENIEFAEEHGLTDYRSKPLLADSFMWRGAWGQAIDLYEAEIAGCAARVGSEHPDCIKLEGNLAFTLLKKGDIEEARARFDDLVTRARVTFEGALGDDMDALLNNAAGAYERVDLFDAARELFEEVHASRRDRLGPEHPLTAHPLNNLGNVYVSLEDWDKAEENFAKALVILEKAQGPMHFHVSFPVHGLGLVARGRGDVEQEILLFRRVAEIRAAGDGSPESKAASWLELAHSLSKLPGNETEAHEAAERSRVALEAARDEEGEDLDEIRGELRRWFEAHPD